MMNGNQEKAIQKKKKKPGKKVSCLLKGVVIFIVIIIFIYISLHFLYERSRRRQEALTIMKIDNNLTFSNNGEYIACSDYKNFYLWKTENGKLIYKKKISSSPRILFSSDSKYLICKGIKVLLLKLEGENTEQYEGELPWNSIYIAFSPDCKYLLGVSEIKGSKSLQLINLKNKVITNNSYNFFKQKGTVCYPAYSGVVDIGDAQPGLVTFQIEEKSKNKKTFSIKLYDVRRQQEIRKIEANLLESSSREPRIPNCYFGGSMLFIVYDQSIKIINLMTGTKRAIIPEDKLQNSLYEDENNYNFSVSSVGDYFVYENSRKTVPGKRDFNRQIYAKIYNADSGKILSKILLNVGFDIDSIAINYDKKLLAVAYRKPFQYFGNKGGQVVIYDIINKKIIRKMKTE